MLEILKNNNEKILLSGVNKEVKPLIKKEMFYKTKLIEGKIYKRTSTAISFIQKQNNL